MTSDIPAVSQAVFCSTVIVISTAVAVAGLPCAASITNWMKMVNNVMEDASFRSDSPSSRIRKRSGGPPGLIESE